MSKSVSDMSIVNPRTGFPEEEEDEEMEGSEAEAAEESDCDSYGEDEASGSARVLLHGQLSFTTATQS